ncbi:MAG: sugar ABC transporter substrate-binding protein [Mycetocola sp.]
MVTKKTFIKYGAIVAAGAMTAASLAACSAGGGGGGDGDSTDKTVTIGMNSGLVPQFEEYAKDFEATHEGWTIEVSAVPDAQPDYIQQLVTQGLSNSTPDIVFNYDTLNQTLVANELLLDLTDYLNDGSDGPQQADFLPNYLAQYQVGDTITGIPVSADSGMIYYNADLFEKYGVDLPEADWTLDDEYAMAKKITDASGGSVYGMVTTIGDSTAYFTWYPVLRAYGSNVYDADSNEFVFADDAGIEAWTELLRPYTEGFGTPYSTPQVDGGALFASDQVAMLMTSNPAIAKFRETVKADWNVQQQPTVNGKSTTGGGSYSLSISAKSGNPDGAWEFMSWFYSTDGGMEAAVPNGVIPPTKDGLENGAWKDDDNPVPANLIPVVQYAVENAILPDAIPDDVQPKVVPALTAALEKVVVQGVSVKEAYTAAQDELNALLK